MAADFYKLFWLCCLCELMRAQWDRQVGSAGRQAGSEASRRRHVEFLRTG